MEAASIRRLVISSLLALVAGAAMAHAQSAPSLTLDTSIRSAGMGGASEAVPWGADGNAWANPALLGYQRGLLHQWNRTPLLPEIATDLVFTSERQSVSACGVGLTQGNVLLDYGLSQGTDNEGSPTETWRSFESTTYEGIGVSASQLADALTGHAGEGGGPLARLPLSPDFAFGYTHKRTHVMFVPGFEDFTDEVDWGVLAKVTPLRVEDLFGAPAAIEVAGGHSVLGADASRLFGNPLARIARDGVAARLVAGVPSAWRESTPSGWKRWLIASLDPFVDLTMAFDSEDASAGGEDPSYDVTRYGGELALGNVLWLRAGHVRDKEGHIDGMASGWGLGYSLGGVIGYRYDHATTPVADDSGLKDGQRHGWIAWLDPLAMMRMMK